MQKPLAMAEPGETIHNAWDSFLPMPGKAPWISRMQKQYVHQVPLSLCQPVQRPVAVALLRCAMRGNGQQLFLHPTFIQSSRSPLGARESPAGSARLSLSSSGALAQEDGQWAGSPSLSLVEGGLHLSEL